MSDRDEDDARVCRYCRHRQVGYERDRDDGGRVYVCATCLEVMVREVGNADAAETEPQEVHR